ncbi:J domain-containing protein [Photobacterium halotolerans]|uniref:J domain-containing protein n=1 Tax=Photobacterium halotolerans TaxID=265726 RepID=UPI00139D0A62|nr:J domain-containing protein [Photobacterium halotolerans]NAW88681.1 J domain-containing protein [Photobacterium halotolerans]
MGIWDVLEIEITTDEAAIKKAYRRKLRQHHPEDDPAGFQRVREAYERALATLNEADGSATAPILDDAEHIVPLSVRVVSDGLAEVVSQFAESLNQLISNPCCRFKQEQWQSWIEPMHLLPITQQQAVSDTAAELIMSNPWLPGEVIEILWQGLGWPLLLTGTERQREVGENLDAWRQQSTSVELADLDRLSGAEQRAALSFLRPFDLALGYGDTEALGQILRQPTTTLFLSSVKFRIRLLKACQACHFYPASVIGSLVKRLVDESAESLTIRHWEVIGEVGLKFDDHPVIHQVSEGFMALNAFGEVAEVQYQQALKNNPLLAMCYAFLRQQWKPLPPVFWRAERRLLPAPESGEAHRMFDWLYGQLIELDQPTFNHRLDFLGLDGLEALLVKAFWAGRFGSWAWMETIRQQLKATKTDFGERFAVTLTLIWLEEQLASQTACVSLQKKLALYETDAFFEVAALTEEEVQSQDKSQWLKCIARHPLVPDSWFHQLIEREILTKQDLWDVSVFPAYADSLSFFRCVNPEFRLSSCWLDAPFDGIFDWALFFFSHMSPVGVQRQKILDTLPVLPSSQADGPFTKLIPFALQPDVYLPDALQSLNVYPEQFVFRSIVDAQVTLLTRTCDQTQLITLAKNGDVAACCALSRLLEHDHFDEAIVYWNLTAAALGRHPHFLDVIVWQQQSLTRLREEKGLKQESYRVTNPTFIHAMLTRDKDWFMSPAEMAEFSPADEAKNFHYPMYHLLTQLHLGLGDKGYDLSALEMFTHRRALQTDLQRETTDVAIAHLEVMYQHRLEQDIQHKGKKAATFSKTNLQWMLVVFCTAWLFSFPSTFGQIGKQDIFQLSASAKEFAKIFFIPLFIYLVWKISSQIIERDNKCKFVLYSGFMLWIAQISQSLFCAIVTMVTLFSTTRGLTDLLATGGWEKKVVKSRRVNLRQVLGFKDKKK